MAFPTKKRPRKRVPSTQDLKSHDESDREDIVLCCCCRISVRVDPRLKDIPSAPRVAAANVLSPSFEYPRTIVPLSEDQHKLVLNSHIERKGLRTVVPPKTVRTIAKTAAKKAPHICKELQVSRYATADLTRIGLYDLVIFCDDSSSMHSEDRFPKMKKVAGRIADIASRYNSEGVTMKFINFSLDADFNNLKGERDVNRCLANIGPSGATPLGIKLRQKVTEPLIIEKARRKELKRPMIVNIVTDGEPTDGNEFANVILETKTQLNRLPNALGRPYGSSSVIFQISRVGTADVAVQFIKSLETHPAISSMVFCTDETIDHAVRRSGESQGKLNTWLTQLLAGAAKR